MYCVEFFHFRMLFIYFVYIFFKQFSLCQTISMQTMYMKICLKYNMEKVFSKQLEINSSKNIQGDNPMIDFKIVRIYEQILYHPTKAATTTNDDDTFTCGSRCVSISICRVLNCQLFFVLILLLLRCILTKPVLCKTAKWNCSFYLEFAYQIR